MAKVELALGNVRNAIGQLKRALEINHRFFGSSPNVAIIHLTLAQAYLKAQDVTQAEKEALTALNMYSKEVGKDSKFVAYAHRILGEIYLQAIDIEKAEDHCDKAHKILTQEYTTTPHFAEIGLLESKIQLQKKESLIALRKLWQARSMFIKFNMREKIQEVDQLLLSAYLMTNVEDWDRSVTSYQQYLRDFPDSIHNQLGVSLVQQLEYLVKDQQIIDPEILDIFCGAGFISQMLVRRENVNAIVVGVDGSEAMINEARVWQRRNNQSRNAFYQIPNECKNWNTQKYDFVTMHMGINQTDLRARHFLFQKILPSLDMECIVLFSTYAADFQFPEELEQIYQDINAASPFKKELFNQFDALGYNPGRCLEDSISPVFTKENIYTLSCFFELYGFQLMLSNVQDIPLLRVNRTWADRVAFTQIPVISRKVFNSEIPQTKWRRIQTPKDYSDVTYGTIVVAKRLSIPKNVPTIFSHVNVDFSHGHPVRYAASVVLKDRTGQILFPKRGSGARDHQGSWSMPSTFADEDKGLKGSLYESLQRNMNIRQNQISSLEPLSIRFSLRENPNGEKWIMAMCLFEGILDGEPELITPKYESYTWEDGPKFVSSLKSREMGDCTKSFRDLINCGLYDGTT